MSEPTEGPYFVKPNCKPYAGYGEKDTYPLMIGNMENANYIIASVVKNGVADYETNARLFAESWAMRQVLIQMHASLSGLVEQGLEGPAKEMFETVDGILKRIAGEDDE